MTKEQRDRLLAITDYDEYDRQRDTFDFPTFGSGEKVDEEVAKHLVWLSNQKFPGEAHIDPDEGDLFEPRVKKKPKGAKMKKFSDLIEKSAVQQEPDGIVKSRFKIAKSDDDKMLAFGWASISTRADGEVIEDWQEDIIEPEVLEEAAYEYVRLYRDGGEMHDSSKGVVAELVESVVFTPQKILAMGIPEGTLPIGWWIGFKVNDPDVWDKVKDGTYRMFSIEGEAVREEVNPDE